MFRKDEIGPQDGSTEITGWLSPEYRAKGQKHSTAEDAENCEKVNGITGLAPEMCHA